MTSMIYNLLPPILPPIRQVTLLLLIPVFFTCSGCSLIAREPSESLAVAERQSQLLEINDWLATGRIALVSGDQVLNVAMRWQQISSDYAVTLTGPLGVRLLQGQQIASQAELQVRGRKRVSGSSLEVLVQRSLNAPVPMEQLGFWLRGLPGDATNPVWDEFGRLASMEYLDAQGTKWEATISKYTHVGGIELPALIDVLGGRNQIKVSVKEWNLQPDSPLVPGRPQTPTTPNNRIPIPGVT